MTRNQLKTRLNGHQTHINKHQRLKEIDTSQAQDEINRLKETTALMNHTIEEGHDFDLTKTIILDHSRRATTLPILEMCHITNNTNTINYRTDVNNLNTTYAGILHTLNNKRNKRNRRNLQTDTTTRHSP